MNSNKQDCSTLCLNMIVRDESHLIHKTLTHLTEKLKFDYWVICDTGSTDSTAEIIEEFFLNAGISGEIHHHTWKDFSHNRNLALEAAFGKTDYLFIFDADDHICGDLVLPSPLQLDSYYIEFGGGFRYHRQVLINNRKRWNYVGVLHEVIQPAEEMGPVGPLEGNYYCISGKSGSRSNNPDKYKKDAATLESAYKEDPSPSWLKPRYAFYCAQSYKDAGNWEKAIEWYNTRVSLGEWVQEMYISQNCIGDILANSGDIDGALRHWLKACDYDAHRYETLSKAAKHYDSKGQHLITRMLYDRVDIRYLTSNPNCTFIDERLHNYGLLCDMILFYAQHNYLEKTTALILEAFARKELIGSEWQAPILHNAWFLSRVSSQTSDFANRAIEFADVCRSQGIVYREFAEVFDHFVEKLKPDFEAHHHDPIVWTHSQPILVTITSCKRLSLLIKTLNSLRHACVDLGDALDIVCIDDGSSEDDRDTMRHLYPWVRFIMKSPDQKGHRASMEIIRHELSQSGARYWMQLEDDWTFIRRDTYISKSLAMMEKYREKGIRQLLFNKGYAEVSRDIEWPCGEPLEHGILIHVHGRPDHPCGYWPHFSLRPSVISVEAIDHLGSFASPNDFFEKDYADRYIKAGFRSAYLDRISCIHTGSLAGTRANGPNAYALNGVSQGFDTGVSVDLPIKLVNLDRRSDRLANMRQRLGDKISYEVIRAIDGLSLKPEDPRLQKFIGNDYGSNPGTIGCAQTQIELWERLLQDETTDYYIIMEDDCEFGPHFSRRLRDLAPNLSSEEMVMLGYSMFNHDRCRTLHLYTNEGECTLHDLDRQLYVGGTFLYSINKQGAAKALDIVSKKGVVHGIDYLIVKTPEAREIAAKEVRPHIASSPWNEGNGNTDSDICNNWLPLEIAPKESDLVSYEESRVEAEHVPNLEDIVDMIRCPST